MASVTRVPTVTSGEAVTNAAEGELRVPSQAGENLGSGGGIAEFHTQFGNFGGVRRRSGGGRVAVGRSGAGIDSGCRGDTAVTSGLRRPDTDLIHPVHTPYAQT